MPLILLNLDRRDDRLKAVLQGLSGTPLLPVLRFRAFDGLIPQDVQYLEQHFHRRACDFPHSTGNFCNRYSQLLILRHGIEQAWPIFAVAEDDISLWNCQHHLLYAAQALALLPGSDIFFLCGWDYRPKTSAFGRLNPVKRAQCTLGTAFSVYSREGAIRLLTLADRYPEMPLDQAVGQLTMDGALCCLGYRFNPYRQNPLLGTDVQAPSAAPSASPVLSLRSLKDILKHRWRVARNSVGL